MRAVLGCGVGCGVSGGRTHFSFAGHDFTIATHALDTAIATRLHILQCPLPLSLRRLLIGHQPRSRIVQLHTQRRPLSAQPIDLCAFAEQVVGHGAEAVFPLAVGSGWVG